MTSHDIIALFPLPLVLFPYVSMPLYIFEQRYKIMVSDCLHSDKPFGIVLADRESQSEQGQIVALHTTGTMARIEQAERLFDGTYNITVRGESRFLVQDVFQERPYLTAQFRTVWDAADDPLAVQPVFDSARELFKEYVAHLYGPSTLSSLQIPEDAAFLSYAIAAVLQIELPEKQGLLADVSPLARLQQLVEYLKRELVDLRALGAQHDATGDDDPGIRRTISRLDSSYRKQYFSRS